MSIKQETKSASARLLITQIREPQAIPETPIRDPRIEVVLDFPNANLHRRISFNRTSRDT
jgi:hypothetical protein